jgi:hypothetical protein
MALDAVSLVADDIDHDGDIDLVALTPSNRIVVWINDGHGHFTEDEPRPSNGLLLSTTIRDESPDEPVAHSRILTQLVTPNDRRESDVVVTSARPPNSCCCTRLDLLPDCPVRAPPLPSRI